MTDEQAQSTSADESNTFWVKVRLLQRRPLLISAIVVGVVALAVIVFLIHPWKGGKSSTELDFDQFADLILNSESFLYDEEVAHEYMNARELASQMKQDSDGDQCEEVVGDLVDTSSCLFAMEIYSEGSAVFQNSYFLLFDSRRHAHSASLSISSSLDEEVSAGEEGFYDRDVIIYGPDTLESPSGESMWVKAYQERDDDYDISSMVFTLMQYGNVVVVTMPYEDLSWEEVTAGAGALMTAIDEAGGL
jgi:hypothetical protein